MGELNNVGSPMDTKTIKDVKDHFCVPSYQRGYKWRERDVEYLIMDLAEYNSENPYYMQPLVVARKNGKWILVDGQQRLTTFYLIWRYMYKNEICDTLPSYSIEYEKRCYSTAYLSKNDNIDLSKNDNIETPDIRNFKKAEVVAERILEKGNLDLKKFKENFFDKATFLWYELDDPDEGPKMFERLNGKKIALTDVELCKVLLLSPENTKSIVRTERGMTWEMMEYALQNNRFYSFISKEIDHFHEQSRMGIILSLICDINTEKEYKDYPIYENLKDQIKQGIDVWQKVISTFHIIEMWYNTPLYYNLIGFLIHGANKPLNEIIGYAAKDDFNQQLFECLKKWIGDPNKIRDLEYKSDRTYPILLLFNILCDMHIKPGKKGDKLADYDFNQKFPFDLYLKDKYDKEHVHATHSKSLSSGIERQRWVGHIMKYINKLSKDENKEIKTRIGDGIISTLEKVVKIRVEKGTGETEKRHKERLNEAIAKVFNTQDFSDIFNKVNNAIEDISDSDESFENDQNSIGNMALLNVGINRDQAYAAAPFAVKSSILKEKIEHGYFVPEGTKMMFFKSFRDNPTEMYHWRKTDYPNGESSDTSAFIETIVNTIKRCIK